MTPTDAINGQVEYGLARAAVEQISASISETLCEVKAGRIAASSVHTRYLRRERANCAAITAWLQQLAAGELIVVCAPAASGITARVPE